MNFVFGPCHVAMGDAKDVSLVSGRRDLIMPIVEQTVIRAGLRAWPITLMYLRDSENLGSMHYFNTARLPDQALALESQYNKENQYFVEQLAELVCAAQGSYEAIVSPPTRRPWLSEPYRRQIAQALDLHHRDITGRFHKAGRRSSMLGATLSELIEDYGYHAAGDEPDLSSLLIVDDTIGQGNSVLALLHHLQLAGMPASAAVTVAVAARMAG